MKSFILDLEPLFLSSMGDTVVIVDVANLSVASDPVGLSFASTFLLLKPKIS